MALIDSLLDSLGLTPTQLLVYGVPFALFIVHALPWLLDPHGIRSIPGPLLAKFSDLWLGWVSSQGHRSEVVHELHKRYGPVVRIAPNHVSIADPAALQTIYAHGLGALKSDFYDAFVGVRSGHRGLFNTRDRTQHSRKRKIVSHIFSQKSVLEFEPFIALHVRQLAGQWDRLCANGAKGLSGDEGQGGWSGRNGRVWLDCLPWYNYLAFDIIGNLAFGKPFGMILSAEDSAPVAVTASGEEKMRTCSLPAVQILNDRGEYSASMGVLPPHWRPFVRTFLPWYRRGGLAVQNLAGLAVAAVGARLDGGEVQSDGRTDLLDKLMNGKDDEGRPMGREELIAEALTQLIAGSDTTSNSSCAVTYYVAKHPAVQRKLQQELDDALGPLNENEDAAVPFDVAKRLPYVQAVINESLRLHSTSGIGLPRVMPDGAPLFVAGHEFPPGTVLSVPSFTIHRDPEVWGEDVESFRPERWFEEDRKDAVARTFNPFSYGPRACVGKNLAHEEMLVIISSIFRRYEFVLEDPDTPLKTQEGFLRKPLACRVGMKRRL